MGNCTEPPRGANLLSRLLLGCGATATVVAGEQGAVVNVLEGADLEQALRKNAARAGRFFKYLSTVLERRLVDRQKRGPVMLSSSSLLDETDLGKAAKRALRNVTGE